MSDLKKPRKQKKSKEPVQIQDLELNKETVADLTEAQAKHVQGGLRLPETRTDDGSASCYVTGCASQCINQCR